MVDAVPQLVQSIKLFAGAEVGVKLVATMPASSSTALITSGAVSEITSPDG